mmetsp:Transcript_16955/g.14885  ORF Transcript_16955/g.14885 Transcript_16955/m.14885 type:complete len:102 (+) Transcript_16955:332-637(+)
MRKNKIINKRNDRIKQVNVLHEDKKNQEFLDSILEVEEESSVKQSVFGSVIITPMRIKTRNLQFTSVYRTPNSQLINSPLNMISKTVVRKGKPLITNKMSV